MPQCARGSWLGTLSKAHGSSNTVKLLESGIFPYEQLSIISGYCKAQNYEFIDC